MPKYLIDHEVLLFVSTHRAEKFSLHVISGLGLPVALIPRGSIGKPNPEDTWCGAKWVNTQLPKNKTSWSTKYLGIACATM